MPLIVYYGVLTGHDIRACEYTDGCWCSCLWCVRTHYGGNRQTPFIMEITSPLDVHKGQRTFILAEERCGLY